MRGAPLQVMRLTIKIWFAIDDDMMRTEHGDRVMRPMPRFHENYDPGELIDHGPHVDRVGLVAVDADFDPGNCTDTAPGRWRRSRAR